MIAANEWYNIAQTGTIGSKTGIKIKIGDYYAMFIVMVDYGSAIITAATSNIPNTMTVGGRIRYNNKMWYADVCISPSQDAELTANLYDNDGWESVPVNTDGSGSTICVINSIISYSENSISTLGELSNVDNSVDNVSTEDIVLIRKAGALHWSFKKLTEIAVLDWFELRTLESGAKVLYTKYNIASEGDQIAGGIADVGSSGSGGGASTLGGLLNVEDSADDTHDIAKVLVKQANATHWSIANLSDIVGLDTEALGDYLTENDYIKQANIGGLFGYQTYKGELSVDNTQVGLGRNRGTAFLVCHNSQGTIERYTIDFDETLSLGGDLGPAFTIKYIAISLGYYIQLDAPNGTRGYENIYVYQDLYIPKTLATTEQLSQKQDIIEDLESIRLGAQAGATALQSYEETDPIFQKSVAAQITDSDIANWNSKTANVGTITGIKMNGESKGVSGVVDLGTVITAHQDISHLLGKTDAANTYATLLSLNSTNQLVSSLSAALSTLRGEFDSLNSLLNDDIAGVIDTWDEVVAFLNSYSESTDLATILSGMNTAIALKADKTDVDKILDWFELRTLESGAKVLYTKYNIASEGDQIAGGIADVGSSGSGGGASYNRLDSWDNYNATAGDVLSAVLGYGLKTEIETIKAAMPTHVSQLYNNAGYITNAALGGYATEQWVLGRDYVTISELATASVSHAASATDADMLDSYHAVDFLLANANNKKTTGISLNNIGTTGDYKWSDPLLASAVFANANNALSILVNGVSSKRMAAIQVGHANTDYAEYSGPLCLNPYAGRVLIGTTVDTGLYKLDVNGGINATAGYISGNAIVHSGNIGNQIVSGLNLQYVSDANNAESGKLFYTGYQAPNTPSGNYAVGLTLYNSAVNYTEQLVINTYGGLFTRYNNGSEWSEYKQIAFTDGNVESANKLANKVKIWGADFDGSSDIAGSFTLPYNKYFQCTDTNEITRLIIHLNNQNDLTIAQGTAVAGYNTYLYGNNIIFRYGINTGEAFRVNPNGNILMGTTTDTGNKLTVAGGIIAYNIYPNTELTYNLGDPTLSWNKVYTRYIDTKSSYDLRLCVGGTEVVQLGAATGLTKVNYDIQVGGSASVSALNITSQDPIAHIKFTRPSANYITTESGGYIAIVPTGKGIATANADLVVTDGHVYPGTTGYTRLGYGDKRWSQVSSVDGDFSGALTAGTFQTSSVVACGGRLRINASNSITSFGFLKATAYSSTLNVGVLDIGSNYGGTATITNEGVDVIAMSMYRGVVGIGRAYTYDELKANYSANIKLAVDGNASVSGAINIGTDAQIAGTVNASAVVISGSDVATRFNSVERDINNILSWFELRTLESGNKVLYTPYTFVSEGDQVAGGISEGGNINQGGDGSGSGTLVMKAYLFDFSGTYTQQQIEASFSVTFDELTEAIKAGKTINITSSGADSGNYNIVFGCTYTLTSDKKLNTLSMMWWQYSQWVTLNLTYNVTNNNYTATITKTTE